MKKASIIARKAIVFATGKAITLLGIVVSLNSCLMKYGSPPPQPPQYWSDQAPEMTNPLSKNAEKNIEHEQTPETDAQDGSIDRR